MGIKETLLLFAVIMVIYNLFKEFTKTPEIEKLV